ncbi:hypothetical protein Moror_5823 [Moniliophthora roreri MCA 2997]|uniref:Uncharacterized protein n=1 Tax=Moniliophthora roreri (strain MCA 2997) TaxID=1381753 RepID=V2X465_MONRO|nr:hypothetical protein Moror_5823 [Moniliophthora roreri MCA 2997]
MEPLPYNITISAQSAAIEYTPSRSDTKGIWNATYTHGTTSVSPFGNQGIGDCYLQTVSEIAHLSLTWIGTAAYLYGNMTDWVLFPDSPAYSGGIDIDDDWYMLPDPKSNLLVNVTDLPYGSHKITLYGPYNKLLAFQYAILTIGIGYEGSSFQVQNRSIPAFLDNKPNDAFFGFHKSARNESWSRSGPSYLEKILPNGGRQPVPLAMFNVAGASNPILAFNVTNASAFFMRGFVGEGRLSKIATLTPGLDGSSSKITVFDDFSPILDYDQVLYWESGLDRDQNYTVEIRGNLGTSNSGFLDFHTLDIIDGGPDPSKQIQMPSLTKQVEKQVPAASIAGITVGAVLSIIILTILVLHWLRRRRDQAAHETLGASHISPFVGTKSDYPRRAGPGIRSKLDELEPHGAPPSSSSESNSNSNPPPSISASVTRRALRHLRRLRFTSPSSIHEVDAGPVILPPRYDHSWVANADANEPAPAPPASRRVLPVPPGPPLPPIFNEKVVVSGPSSS